MEEKVPKHSSHHSDSLDQSDFDMDTEFEEPAGILTDLTPSARDQTLSLAEFYQWGDPIVINHHPERVFQDIYPVREGSPGTHNLGHWLHLQISKPDHLVEDVYKPRAPSLIKEVFSRTPLTPKMRSISVAEAPVQVQIEDIDVRELTPLGSSKQFPDIFILELTPRESIIRWYSRHKKGLFIAIGLGMGTTVILILTTLGLALYARDQVIQGYDTLATLRIQDTATLVESTSEEARGYFRRAQVAFLPASIISSILPDSSKVENAKHVIDAGLGSTELMSRVSTLRNILAEGVTTTASGWALTFFDTQLFTDSSVGITDIIAGHTSDMARITELVSEIEYHFSSITTTGSTEHDITLEKLRWLLRTTGLALGAFDRNRDELLQILGHKKPMHYLVLNQNRDELRANGGFPGSAVEVTLYKGRLMKYEKRDIYFYDWHLFPYSSTPPAGIDQVTSAYGIRDANYDPDFAKSFETIAGMFEKAGGGTLDGAIAINQWTIQKLLAITWPIRVDGIREPVSAENFTLLLSVLVEGEFARVGSAKDILFKTVESFEKELVEQGAFGTYLNILEQDTIAGEILLTFRDSSLESYWKSLSKSPHIWESGTNFVAPVFTSLSGNKSDRYVERDFMLKSSLLSGCKVLNTVNITSRHLMTPTDVAGIESLFNQYGLALDNRKKEIEVQGNGENRQYLRLLIPKNSTLVSSSGAIGTKLTLDASDLRFDMITTNIRTLVGQKSEVRVEYESTPAICQSELVFQPQPGLQKYQILR